MVYFFQIDVFNDATWHSVGAMTWTLVEPGVYLIAATLPSLRPLVLYIFKVVKLETLYGRPLELLERCSRTLSTHKHSGGSSTKTHLNPANERKTMIKVGNGARSVGFSRLTTPRPKARDFLKTEPSWVAERDEDMHSQ